MNILRIGAIFCLLIWIQPLTAQVTGDGALDIKTLPLSAGQIIQIKFDGSKAGLATTGEPVYAVMFVYKSGKVKVTDTLMTGKKMLSAKFIVPDTADAIAFKFMQGIREYANNGNGYYYTVNDKDGQVQIGSSYSLYRLNSGDYLAGITKGNAKQAEYYYNDWFQAQDIDKMPYYDKAISLFIRKDTLALLKHFAAISEAKGITEDQFTNLAFYTRLNGKATSKIVENEKVKQFPRGKWYWRTWIDSIRKFQTIQEKLVWIKAFQFVCPEDSANEYPLANELYFDVLRTAVRNRDLQSVILYSSLLEGKKNAEERLDYYYTDFIKNIIANDTLLDDAYNLIKKPLQRSLAKTKSFVNIQPYQSNQMYLKESNKQYMELASIYGEVLYKMKQYDSSFYYSRLAAVFEEFKSPLYNERYFLAMEKIKPPLETVEAMKPVLKGKGVSFNLKEQFLRVYKLAMKRDGTTVLEELLADAKNKMKEEVKSKILDMPSPDFNLPGLNGGSISLSSLKGKVVLLDFWATWCGPCVAAFPAMQQLVNSNKTNSNVAIFFVNTWQKEKDKFATVSQFLKDKPYKIDVYMDADDKAVKDFNIKGIPTKVIIDKKGRIRFISVGFNGDEQKAVDELQAMLDIAAEQ